MPDPLPAGPDSPRTDDDTNTNTPIDLDVSTGQPTPSEKPRQDSDPNTNDASNPPAKASEVYHQHSLQSLITLGRRHMSAAELELALRAFTSALHLCGTYPAALGARRFEVLGDLGFINRLMGRYEVAKGMLEEAMKEAGEAGWREGGAVGIAGEYVFFLNSFVGGGGRLDSACSG